MITTRTQAVDFLKSQEGFIEAMAKVVVNECFTFTEDDKLQLDGKLVQMEDSEMRDLYENMVLNEIDVDEQFITVLGERKYNLFGDLLPTQQPAAETAETEAASESDGAKE